MATAKAEVGASGESHAFGEVGLNPCLLSQNHIPLHVYNYYGYWSGRTCHTRSEKP